MMAWWAQNPALLHAELGDVRQGYPEFQVSTAAMADGVLALYGSLPVRDQNGTEDVPIVLVYPKEFPYRPPVVLPHRHPLSHESTVADFYDKDKVRYFPIRHQMASGGLCLFEARQATGLPDYVSGVETLMRAEKWLQYAYIGRTPPGLDSQAAALSEHYQIRGDILICPPMYSQELSTSGRFICVRERGDERPLYAVTHLQEGENYRSIAGLYTRALPSVVEILSKHLGNGDSKERRTVDSLAESEDFLVCRWFTLQDEPAPVRTIEQLASILYPDAKEDPVALMDREYALDRLRAATVVIGLRFPARSMAGWDWLFLHVRLREVALEMVEAPGMKIKAPLIGSGKDTGERWHKAEYGVLWPHDLSRPKLELRNRGVVPSTTGDLCLGVLGAGALGSLCADLFGKAGPRKLMIWDNSVLEAANCIRHILPISFTGLPKAHGVGVSVAHHSPYCEVECSVASVLDAAKSEGQEIWQPDILLSTIADDSTELIFNAYAVAAGKTVYYLRGLRRGEVGRLVRVVPGRDACLECVARYHREEHGDAIVVLPTDGEVLTRECGQAVLAASAADLALIAGMGVRTVLHDIAGGGGTNHWVWTGPGAPGCSGLEAQFSMRTATLTPHPDCLVCSEGKPYQVVLPPLARAKMLSLSRRAMPNETGGILVGRLVGRTVIIEDVSDAGPNAEILPHRFVRDGVYCQQFLENVARGTMHSVDYIGDWHSHPGCSATPSLRDITSMLAIANDPDYLTSTPVMLIVGLMDPEAPVISASVFDVERRIQSAVVG